MFAIGSLKKLLFLGILKEFLIDKKFMKDRNDIVKENYHMKKINTYLIKIIDDLNDNKNVGQNLKQYLDLLVRYVP